MEKRPSLPNDHLLVVVPGSGRVYSTRSTSPLLVSSGNKLDTWSLIFFPLLSGEYTSRRRIECEVRNWTNRRSRSCQSIWNVAEAGFLRSVTYGWMVIWRRLLDSTVWSAVMIQQIVDIGLEHRNVRSLSFVALERSRGDTLCIPILSSKVPANQRS